MTRVIGVMSGSSLDGIDVACCTFERNGDRWHWSIEEAGTFSYDAAMRGRLLRAMEASALELARLHRDLGGLIGDACSEALKTFPAELIASHGHTIFHKPDEALTLQIGCGATIAARTGIATVCDFRTKDVGLGGQGAPLVPIGERMLFAEHSTFVNLGGIANISQHLGTGTTGFDIGPCNQALNLLAEEAGQPYDANGDMARTGSVDQALLEELNTLPFYRLEPPRSLGREWFEVNMRPLLAHSNIPVRDRLRTAAEHIAGQVAQALASAGAERALFTGGGAHNGFLLERLRSMTHTTVEVPQRRVVDFKEALIFAFLGLLRLRGEVTALASVTGAKQDSIGGGLYLAN